MSKLFRSSFWVLTILLGLFVIAGCGSSKNKEGGDTTVVTGTTSTTGNIQVSIQSAVVSSTTGSLDVTFTLLDENGAPVDPAVLVTQTGGAVRFYVAQLDATGNYKNYVHKSGAPTNDSNGVFATIGNGVYTYTFGKNITTSTSPAYDAALTHTVAAQIARVITTDRGASLTQTANPYFNFRPDGNSVTATREVVAVSNCNECHGALFVHGSRKDIALCILCHNPGLNGTGEKDLKKTGNSIDMKSMIHKIHMGQKLSSNVGGANYGINTHNYKPVKYPSRTGDSFSDNKPIDCVKCHKAGTDAAGRAYGADVDKWKTTPTRANCTTCHDTHVFDGVTAMTFTTSNFNASGVFTSASTTPVTGTVHSGGNQADDTACAGCHTSVDDFAYSTPAGSYPITASHLLPMKSSLNTGLNFTITSVTGAVSGQTPAVTFTVTDNLGSNVTLTGGNGSGTLADSVTVVMTYMTGADYDNTAAEWIAGQSYVTGKRVTVSSTSVNPANFSSGDSYVVSFGSVTVPAGTGVGTIAIYGKKGVRIPAGQSAHRLASQRITGVFGTSAFYNFDLATGTQVTDPSALRREVVSIDNCNKCHTKLNVHSRPEIKLCVMCHAPKLLNTKDEGYSGNLKDMIHSVHGAKTTSYTSTVIFKGMEPAEYPNDPRNCTACHISIATAGIPLPDGVTAGSLRTGTTTTSLDKPAVLPIKAACTTCHELWTSHATEQTLGGVETCTTNCHVSGSSWGPDRAHEPVKK